MEKSVIEYFKTFPFIGLDDIKLIYSLGQLKRIKAGEIIIKIGELNYSGIFVLKGLLRNYIITNDGEERTLLFCKEGNQTGSHSTIFYNKPAKENIEAIEDSVVFMLNSEVADKIAGKHPKLLKLQNNILKKVLAESVERIIFFTTLSPEERFKELCTKQPNLVKRVPQKYLASYVGVTTVSLSRIKSRINVKR
jgi:CRP-like cAMP-binding protein